MDRIQNDDTLRTGDARKDAATMTSVQQADRSIADHSAAVEDAGDSFLKDHSLVSPSGTASGSRRRPFWRGCFSSRCRLEHPQAYMLPLRQSWKTTQVSLLQSGLLPWRYLVPMTHPCVDGSCNDRLASRKCCCIVRFKRGRNGTVVGRKHGFEMLAGAYLMDCTVARPARQAGDVELARRLHDTIQELISAALARSTG